MAPNSCHQNTPVFNCHFVPCWLLVGCLFEAISDANFSYALQMEEFLVGKGNLQLPAAQGQDTIFEFLVNEQGHWEHWSERVS